VQGQSPAFCKPEQQCGVQGVQGQSPAFCKPLQHTGENIGGGKQGQGAVVFSEAERS